MDRDSGLSYQSSGGSGTRLAGLIASNIQKISGNVGQIRRMVDQIGSPADSDQLRARLHELQHYTNNLAKDSVRQLKELTNSSQHADLDQRQWKIQKEKLVNEFTTVLNNFQEVQRDASKREKDSVLRARVNSGISGNPFADDSSAIVPPARSQLQATIEQNVDVNALQEREQSIRQLESDIVDVNQIFKDLALMVHEQGEMVDSIESNIEHAQISVEEGHSNVVKAHNYQEKARRKKFTLIAIGVIVLIVLILIIYLASS